MANGARMEGIDADVFFTFFGLDAIRKGRDEKIKVATVGNPGMHLPTLLGALPGFSALATKHDAAPDREARYPADPRVRRADRRLRRRALRLPRQRRHVRPHHRGLRPAGEDIISVGEFYSLAAGGQIIFT